MDKSNLMRWVVGIKQTRKAVLNGTAVSVFLACDADPLLTEPIAELCKEQNIRINTEYTMQFIGHQGGISVGSAAAAEVR